MTKKKVSPLIKKVYNRFISNWSIKSILKKKERINLLFYLSSDLLARMVPFLLLPIATHYLSLEQFGNIALFTIMLQISVIFLSLGTTAFYRGEFFQVENQMRLLSQLIYLISILALFLLLILVIFYMLCFNCEDLYIIKWLPHIFIIAYFQAISLLFIAYFQCKEQAHVVGIINVVSALLFGIGTVFLLSLGIDERAQFYSLLFSTGLSFFILFSYFKYKKELIFTSYLNKNALKFGVSMLPHALSWWMRGGLDRLLVGSFLSVSLLGVYTLALQLTSGLMIITNAVIQAYTPTIMRYLANKQFSDTKRLLYKILFFICITCILSVCVSPLLFHYFIDEKFHDALIYFQLMSINFIFQAILTVYSVIFYFYKQTKRLSLITVCTSISHIIILYLLLSLSVGLFSVIISSAITSIIMAAFIFIKTNQIMLIAEKAEVNYEK